MSSDEADPFELHAARFLVRLQSLTQSFRSSSESVEILLQQFDKQRPQIDAAFAWAEKNLEDSVEAAVLCARFAGCADPGRGNSLLNMRQSHAEGRHWIERALESCRRLGSRVNEAVFLGRLAQSEFAAGEVEEAILHAQAALGHFRDLGDDRRAAITLTSLSHMAFAKGDDASSALHLEEALAIFRFHGMVEDTAYAHSSLAVAYLRLKRFEDALRVAEDGVMIARKKGDRRNEATALQKIASAFHGLGQEDKALTAQLEATAILEGLADSETPWNAGHDTYEVARLLATGAAGDIEKLERSLAAFRKIEHWLGEGFALAGLGLTNAHRGDRQAGTDYLEQALDLFTKRQFWIGANVVRKYLAEFAIQKCNPCDTDN